MLCHTHLIHSPDLAPSDYHLLRSLQNSLDGETFGSIDDIKNHLVRFFDNTCRQNLTFLVPHSQTLHIRGKPGVGIPNLDAECSDWL